MTQFTDTLRTWRKARRFSQLDLALEADVSARHISFLETGRAKPSREMVKRLGEALRMPLISRNEMLTHAGYAAVYQKRNWNAAEMAPIRAAVNHTLSSHAPYPAVAIDRLWNVLRMNEPAMLLFDFAGMQEGSSLLDLMMSDKLASIIENWPEVAGHAVRRLRTESVAMGGVKEFERVIDHLRPFAAPDNVAMRPVITTIYCMGDQRLSFFSTIAQFGTPLDLTLDELKIELFFPADDETDHFLRQTG